MTQIAHLILVPTRMEADLLAESLTRLTQPSGEPWQSLLSARIELIGFGPVTAAARTASLLETHPVQRISLVGIAGLFKQGLDMGFRVGDAATFSSVRCYGIGAGFGANHQSAGELGWPFWDDNENVINDKLPLTPYEQVAKKNRPADAANAAESTKVGKELVTVTCAASNEDEAAHRAQRYPEAIGEDMEAFGVATACHLAGISLSVVRGFSNLVGDRQHSQWQIKPALESVASFLLDR